MVMLNNCVAITNVAGPYLMDFITFSHEMKPSNKLIKFYQSKNIRIQFYIYPLTLHINISF